MWLILLDRGLLGALLLLAAYILNRQLETFKQERALALEFAKRRLDALARAFELVHLLDDAHDMWGTYYDGPNHTSVVTGVRELRDHAMKGRFYLGEEFASAASRYAELHGEDLAAFEEYDLRDRDDPNADARWRDIGECREVMTKAVPKFARVPLTDQPKKRREVTDEKLEQLKTTSQLFRNA